MIDRVRTRDEFVRLRRDGRRLRIDPFWCTHLIDPSAPGAHVAFAISRAAGNAVTRNKLRRRMKAALADLELPHGWYLFGCRPGATELTFDQLTSTLERLPAKLAHAATRDQS